MIIHEKTEVSHVRVYEDGNSYTNKDPFRLIITIHYLGEDEVFLSGAKGTLDKNTCLLIRDYLKGKGIKTIRFERSHKQQSKEKVFRI